jgi:hypothetical protein
MKNLLKKIQQKIYTIFQSLKAFASKLRISSFVGGQFKERDIRSEDYEIYLRHMKNTTGTPKERWVRVCNTIIDPMVVLPILIGLGLIILSSCISDDFLKSVFYYLSAFGIGIGVNHFSTVFRDQNEYNELKKKAEFTVRLLNDRIISILRKNILDDKDKDTISGLLTVMNGWKDYYDKADTSQIAYHKRLKEEFENEQDQEVKSKKKNDLELLEYELLGSGLTSYVGLSGSTAYDYYVNKPQ